MMRTATNPAISKFFKQFDRIYVINLPERRDRRRAIEREFQKIGFSTDHVEFFKAIKPREKKDFTSIGARGVYNSHLSILKRARDLGHSVLILEDDCKFNKDAFGCPTERWDVFYGGYYASDPDDLQSSDIIGAHMMGFTADAVRRVTDYLEKLSYQGTHPPIDAAYVWFRRQHPEVKTAFARPPIAEQRRSRSDIASLALYDRLPLVRNLANAVRGLLP